MKIRRSNLLAAASLLPFIAPFGAAQAFDQVNWTWDATVTEAVTKNVDVTVSVEPSGMTMLENLQVQIGNVSAESVVSGITNQPPSGGTNGPMEVDLGTLNLDADYGLGGTFLPGGTATGDVVTGATVVSGVVDETDVPPNVNGNVMSEIDLGSIIVDIPPSEGLDAELELPEVVSSATAVGNNSTINSDVMVEMHEGQFLFGTGELSSEEALGAALGGVLLVDALDGTNSNLIGSALVGAGAILGVIQPVEITALSDVSDIANASVDSSATAVGNNKTINLAAITPADNLLIGDVTQFAVANVSATSNVSGVGVQNYANLGVFRTGGGLDRPLVGSVATAVGNNLSVTVGSVQP